MFMNSKNFRFPCFFSGFMLEFYINYLLLIWEVPIRLFVIWYTLSIFWCFHFWLFRTHLECLSFFNCKQTDDDSIFDDNINCITRRKDLTISYRNYKRGGILPTLESETSQELVQRSRSFVLLNKFSI